MISETTLPHVSDWPSISAAVQRRVNRRQVRRNRQPQPKNYQNETLVGSVGQSPEVEHFESAYTREPGPRLDLGIFLLLLTAPLLRAADLKSDTLRAWDAYVRQTQARTDERVSGRSPFLWVDGNPELSGRVRAGEVVAEPEDGESPHAVPHGLIHDWVGAVFLPNAKLDDVTGTLKEYAHYRDFYWPMVAESSLLAEAPYRESVRLLMVQKAYSVTAAVQADDEVQSVRVDVDRAYIISSSLRVREIADYGKPGMHALPEDHGPGYVWRTFTITRLEQRDGGTYVEMEMIALSRGIPWEFRWLMQPLAERLPRNLVAAMVSDTRTAVYQETVAGRSKGAVAAQSLARDDGSKSQLGSALARVNR